MGLLGGTSLEILYINTLYTYKKGLFLFFICLVHAVFLVANSDAAHKPQTHCNPHPTHLTQIGGLLSFNVLFPSDQPDIWRLMGCVG